MDLASFLLSWTPVAVLMVLAVGFRCPVLWLSICGTAFTVGLVWGVFHTPFGVITAAAADGILTTLPLVVVVAAGILLSTLLGVTGSLKRIVDWLLGGVRDAYHRVVLIAFGVGNFMEGASVIAEPVIAPMLCEAGVEPRGATALSLVGYSGLMALEMSGIILTVLSLVTGVPIPELGFTSAVLSIPATVAMAVCLPLFLPAGEGRWRRLPLLVASGGILGLAGLLAVVYAGVSVSGMLAGCALIAVLLALGPRRLSVNVEVVKDSAPFVLMLVSLLLVNTVPPLRELTTRQLVVSIQVIPAHTITLTPFHSAYLYLFAALALAIVIHRIPRAELRSVFGIGVQKGWRALIAMALFGAMGQIIAYSGYHGGFLGIDKAHSIPWLMSNGLEHYAGKFYPLFVPLLGWMGTFLTGYGVASLMLFGALQVTSAQLLGCSVGWLAAGLAVGASLGSISSPFKIAIAAPMCGAEGQEGRILRLTIPLGVVSSLLVGIVLWFVVR
jgi:lactate permease